MGSCLRHEIHPYRSIQKEHGRIFFHLPSMRWMRCLERRTKKKKESRFWCHPYRFGIGRDLVSIPFYARLEPSCNVRNFRDKVENGERRKSKDEMHVEQGRKRYRGTETIDSYEEFPTDARNRSKKPRLTPRLRKASGNPRARLLDVPTFLFHHHPLSSGSHRVQWLETCT